MAEFNMPSLGADMEVGQLLEWMVKPGAEVKRGDIIAVVGTEKGEIEVEVFEDGIVDELLVSEGTEVPVGAPLAHIRGEGEAAPVAVAATPQPTPIAAALQAGGATVASAAIPPATNGHRPRVSPLARKLAAELGVDLTQITGSGANGAITREDVEAAAK
ncbi:MAG: E3 binding domain-containing protein, partial [Caldilineaceae bacterium]|nr:E3 binding domain-containing protein [Caldilineaceae bacterium]